MRTWHRWLAVIAGIFIVWIATTGLLGQVISLAGGERHDAPRASVAEPGANSTPGITATVPNAADGLPATAKPHKKQRDLYHFIIDLHSGAYFGTLGKVISALVGAALLFFAISGMLMYVNMFRRRKTSGRSGVFWK